MSEIKLTRLDLLLEVKTIFTTINIRQLVQIVGANTTLSQ